MLRLEVSRMGSLLGLTHLEIPLLKTAHIRGVRWRIKGLVYDIQIEYVRTANTLIRFRYVN
jgi:hypothetical protein